MPKSIPIEYKNKAELATGQVFGNLTVIKELGRTKHSDRIYECMCECGKLKITTSSRLRSGSPTSCGCMVGKNRSIEYRQKVGNKFRKHGMSKTTLWQCWIDMNKRCKNEKVWSYKNYGGRGIKVCKEWENFDNFKEWAFSNGYSDKLKIDRVDVNGNYEPSNCKWSTQKEQSNNTNSNVRLTFNKETHTLSEWCEIMKVPYQRIHQRIKAGRKSFDDIFAEKFKKFKDKERGTK